MFRSTKQRKFIIFIATLVLIVSTWQIGITPTSGASSVTPYVRGMTASTVSEYAGLMQRAAQVGSLRVIVMFKNVPYDQRSTINSAQSATVSRLQGTNFTLLRQFKSTPAVLLEVDPTALQSLINDPSVASITEDGINHITDTASNAVIGTTAAYAQGFDGTGQIVAILDTGVQTTHPYFTGKIQAEACFSSTYAPDTGVSQCPNGQSTGATGVGQPGQVGAGAGVNCPIAIVSGCFHGTHVAGIAAGKNYTGSPVAFDGVAKGAKIISVQVFTRFTSAGACNPAAAPCIGAYDSDTIAALDYIYNTFSITYPNIAAINMSLGGGSNAAPCSGSPFEPVIANLRNTRKIATVISAGNNGFANLISSPACAPSAISVGATDNSDAVASFSNRANFLTIFAPGVNIQSSAPTDSFVTTGGTSMSAPHVTGAFAVMKSKSPISNVNVTLNILRAKGPIITFDTNPDPSITLNATAPRLQLDTALRDYGNVQTIGIYRPSASTFYLRNTNTTGFADSSITFGTPTDLPVVGDWNGDGRDTPGIYRNGVFILTDSTASPVVVNYQFALGIAGDTPIVGDWDGDGKDSLGVFRPTNGLLYLRNALTTGFADYTMVLGIPGDVGLAGDWNGDGKDTPGVYRPSNAMFYLSNQQCNCIVVADSTMTFGLVGDQPFVGDWNGDGRTGVGAYRTSNGLTYLRNDPNTTGFADYQFIFGSSSDKAVGGAWQLTTVAPASIPQTAPAFEPDAR